MESGKRLTPILTILLFSLLTACDSGGDQVSLYEVKAQQQQQDALGNKLENLEKRQQKIINDLQVIARATQQITNKQKAFEFTEFDPTQTRYFFLNNGSLGLAGRVLSISPTEGGSIVRLALVNLLSIPVANIGFQATWGGAIPTNAADVARWQQLLFSTAMNSNLELLPGQWQDINLTLKGISPNNLRYLKMSINMEKVVFGVAKPGQAKQVKSGKK